MSVVWEEPASVARVGGPGREPSPLRKEANEMLDALTSRPDQWARLWDMTSKDEARKRSSFAAKKGFSFAIRETQFGWSVYGRYNTPEAGAEELEDEEEEATPPTSFP